MEPARPSITSVDLCSRVNDVEDLSANPCQLPLDSKNNIRPVGRHRFRSGNSGDCVGSSAADAVFDDWRGCGRLRGLRQSLGRLEKRGNCKSSDRRSRPGADAAFRAGWTIDRLQLATAGGTDVYVMPATGGTPVRLTHGRSLARYDNIVTGWTPDGTKVLFLSQLQTSFFLRYETYAVPPSGGLAVPLGLDHSGLSSVSPDGKRIAFNRIFRDLGGDRWKYYVRGQAPEIYIQDLNGTKLERLTDWCGIDTAPMWVGHRIYFLSDRGRDRRANIWVTNIDTKATRQVTHFADYDVDMPSVGPGGIGFQYGARCIGSTRRPTPSAA